MLSSPYVKKENAMPMRLIKFYQESSDGAYFKTKGKTLLAFIPDFTKYGWFDLEKKGSLNTLENKTYHIVLNLMSLDDKKRSKAKKAMTYRHGFEYIVRGIVKKVFEEYLVMDCGIEITLTPLKTAKAFSTGDWIEARGRLDAYLVEWTAPLISNG